MTSTWSATTNAPSSQRCLHFVVNVNSIKPLFTISFYAATTIPCPPPAVCGIMSSTPRCWVPRYRAPSNPTPTNQLLGCRRPSYLNPRHPTPRFRTRTNRRQRCRTTRRRTTRCWTQRSRTPMSQAPMNQAQMTVGRARRPAFSTLTAWKCRAVSLALLHRGTALSPRPLPPEGTISLPHTLPPWVPSSFLGVCGSL